MEKTISCVISSYKYGHLAGHCIDSVISQTRKPDKIYFVDDGVGDCKHLPEIYPEVEYVFRETNLGTVDNFQDMLQRVDTDYVMFLGADNWLRPDTLEILEKELPANIVMYDIQVVGEFSKEILSRHPGETTKNEWGYYWRRAGGHHGSMLYNVHKAKEVGGYNDGHGTRTLEDQSLFNRIKEYGLVKHVNQALLYYRRHRDNFNAVK